MLRKIAIIVTFFCSIGCAKAQFLELFLGAMMLGSGSGYDPVKFKAMDEINIQTLSQAPVFLEEWDAVLEEYDLDSLYTHIKDSAEVRGMQVKWTDEGKQFSVKNQRMTDVEREDRMPKLFGYSTYVTYQQSEDRLLVSVDVETQFDKKLVKELCEQGYSNTRCITKSEQKKLVNNIKRALKDAGYESPDHEKECSYYFYRHDPFSCDQIFLYVSATGSVSLTFSYFGLTVDEE